MPIEKSASVCKKEKIPAYRKKFPTKQQALLQLRHKEVLAYHYICEVFRAQGRLTPGKLKLLKEIAAALYIPDVRHRAECQVVVNNHELSAIAEWMAGPGTDAEWRKEGKDPFPRMIPNRVINTASVRLVDALARALNAHLEELGDDLDEDTVVEKTFTINSCLLEEDFKEIPEKEIKTEVYETVFASDSIKEEITDIHIKEEAKDGDLSSSVSSASDDSQTKEEESKPEPQKTMTSKEETDACLMPPPPPVFITPSPVLHPLPPSPPVITVPPASVPTTITVPATTVDAPQIIDTPIAETPVLSEAEEAQRRADFFSSLPPLVVVPPPDPSETLASPSPCSPSLVLSPGMSIQIRDDTKKRKRSISQSQESVASSGVSASKTVAFSSFSKVTPVMVTTSVSSQAQVKVTPIITRAKMTTTAHPQKVIIVSNTPTSSNQMLQRSLNVPMGSLGLPIVRANQPRFQSITGTGGSTIRPKMVTVPAKSRAKGSPMVNLQLKNAFTLKQDNVTVVDTSVKRLPGGPTKILPKPSGSMFIVNTAHGTRKLATTVAGGREGAKQNVVIVQKGGSQRTLTLSNSNKDLMQKLMSKKCVVIQSSKVVPKTISPKPPPPPAPQPSSVISTSGNTVVLDLSQEQDRQNWGGTTLREILQASGIITSTTQTVTSQTSELAQVSAGEGEWLPVETSKSLSLEEVSLPLGQSESFVTLDEAVEMLEDQHTEGTISLSEGDSFTSTGSDQMFTITSDQLSSGNMTVVANEMEPMAGQIVMEALPSEVASDLDCISRPFLPHKDGAVTIQHSQIDVPANMSLEDYSSQQMENQNFN